MWNFAKYSEIIFNKMIYQHISSWLIRSQRDSIINTGSGCEMIKKLSLWKIRFLRLSCFINLDLNNWIGYRKDPKILAHLNFLYTYIQEKEGRGGSWISFKIVTAHYDSGKLELKVKILETCIVTHKFKINWIKRNIFWLSLWTFVTFFSQFPKYTK